MRLLFNALGALYAVAGAAAVIDSILASRHAIAGGETLYLAFALMYLSFAYLFFSRGWWLLPLSGLNLIINAALWGSRALGGTTSWLGILVLALNAALLYYLYRTRRKLADTRAGRAAAGVAVICGGIGLYLVLGL